MKRIQEHIKRIVVAQVLCLTLALTFGTIGASAIDVPVNVTEISIPIALSANSAIAGGEIGFSQTSGLKYVRFVPASGIDNTVGTTVSGTSYIGFFSADNKYRPANGRITLGNLVFGYSGVAPEAITFSEIKIHTQSVSGVDSKTLKPNTVVNITRQTASGNVPNDNSGSEPSESNPTGNPPANVGTITLPTDEATAANGQTVTVQAGEQEDVAAESATEDSETQLSQTANSGGDTDSDSGTLAENPTPLAPNGGAGNPYLWLWAIPAAAIAALIILLLYRKRRKKQGEALTSTK
jgi:hypothetical protein